VGEGRVEHEVEGWELRGQVRVVYIRKKTEVYLKLPAGAAFFASFLWPFKERRSPKAKEQTAQELFISNPNVPP
jgi:hypothetical protein